MTQFSWSYLRACFIAGAVCAAVAYLLTPQLWWVGLVAGFAVGYLGYEFRETMQVTRQVLKKSPTAVANLARGLTEEFARTDPATQVVLVAWLVAFGSFVGGVIASKPGEDFGFWAMVAIPLLVMGLIIATVVAAVFTGLFRALIQLGATVATKEYWTGPEPGSFWLFNRLGDIDEALKKGFQRRPFTHLNILRWTLLGTGVVIWFCLFYWWYWTITKGVPGAIKIGWEVVKIIHSHERVLCGIDGAIGGIIGYFSLQLLLWDTGVTSPLVTELMVTALGGLLGMVVGTLHWRFARVIIRS